MGFDRSEHRVVGFPIQTGTVFFDQRHFSTRSTRSSPAGRSEAAVLEDALENQSGVAEVRLLAADVEGSYDLALGGEQVLYNPKAKPVRQ